METLKQDFISLVQSGREKRCIEVYWITGYSICRLLDILIVGMEGYEVKIEVVAKDKVEIKVKAEHGTLRLFSDWLFSHSSRLGTNSSFYLAECHLPDRIAFRYAFLHFSEGKLHFSLTRNHSAVPQSHFSLFFCIPQPILASRSTKMAFYEYDKVEVEVEAKLGIYDLHMYDFRLLDIQIARFLD